MQGNRKKLLISLSLLLVCLFSLKTARAEKASSSSRKEDSQIITPKTFVRLAKRLNPAVVNINTTRIIRQYGLYGHRSPFSDDFFDLFFRGVPRRQYKQRSLGSGFIIDNQGYILTNKHVIADMDSIRVTLHDRSSYAARVVGSYAKLDISLIRISADKKLPSVQLGNSDKLEVGDWVMAIGNPFGLDHTVTTGIISAKGRVIGAGPYDDFLQTDASINPGNSGGPLFNLAGEVIGINTAILQNGRGIGFAIPVNMAREIVDKLTGKKGTEQAWIGLRTQELTPQLARSFGLKSLDGVLVSEVFYDSPAYRAGIEVGDIIVSFAETPVETPSDFRRLLATVEPYTNVPLEIVRYNRRYRLKLAVVSQP